MLAPVTWQDDSRQYLSQPRVLWAALSLYRYKGPFKRQSPPSPSLSSHYSSEEAGWSLPLLLSLCISFPSSLPFTLLSINSSLKFCLHGVFVSRPPRGLWPSPDTWPSLVYIESIMS